MTNKRKKKLKIKFGEKSTFGEVYEFKGVRYWIYQRKNNSGDLTSNYFTKIKIEGEREIRRSCKSSELAESKDIVKEMIIEFLFKVEAGDIGDNKEIKIVSEKVKANRKPSFDMDEWNKVKERSKYRSSEDRLWKNNKDTQNKEDCISEPVLQRRILLHDFINFMVGSGLRTTEAMNLKWKNIVPNQIIEDNNGKIKKVKSVKLYVSGKGKERKCDPQPYVRDVLDRIKERQIKFSKENKFKFKGKEEYVFSDEHGNQIVSFRKSFSSLLEDCDLLYDPHGTRRVIGSLRHTYGSLRKSLGEVDSHDLAINMGTSVNMIEKFYVHSDDYDRSSSITRIRKKIK